MPNLPQTRRFRTLFISDLHLGMRACRADMILDFLRWHDADTIYLVGDIVDGWQLRRDWYWPQPHNDVVQKLLRKARKGSRVIYVPGNHDEFMRAYPGKHFGGIEVVQQHIHETATGKRYLVVHGDHFDAIVLYAKWISVLGDRIYSGLLMINRAVAAVRQRCGFGYWSLAHWMKKRVKGAVNLISAYEQAVVAEATRHGVDGVICGHIHHPALHRDFGISYANCGDWVESCTAIAEGLDGTLELIRWHSLGLVEPPVEVDAADPIAA